MLSKGFYCGWHGVLAACVVLAAAWAVAGQRTAGVARLGEADPNARTVELFSAVASGDIEVRLIPRDERRCRGFVENKTDRPLRKKRWA